MPGAGCADCHMYASDVDGSNSKNFGGHTWAISVAEPDGTTTTSCAVCHSGMGPAAVATAIQLFQTEYQKLGATAEASCARAAAAMQGNQNPDLLATLNEAQFNLGYAESDESGGFHNFAYLMSLLNDANTKALSFPIVDAIARGNTTTISWTGPGTLQAAEAITGPWHDVSGAANPMTITPDPQHPQQFYRLRP